MKTTFTLTALCRDIHMPAALRKSLAIAAMFLFAALPVRADVVFNATNFPDPIFRQYLIDFHSTNGFTAEGVTISDEDLNGVTAIHLTSLPDVYLNTDDLISAQGIEYFPKLKSLAVEGLTTLDISQNTELIALYASGVTSLDLSHNPALRVLEVGGGITSLDLSSCPDLNHFKCQGSKITSLDLSEHTQLASLTCTNNSLLTSLDVSGCTSLTTMDVRGNKVMTTLNLNGCTGLEEVNVAGGLTSLDVSGCRALKYLNCSNNQLTSLNLSQNPMLTNLYCRGNKLTVLDLSHNPLLYIIELKGNRMVELDFSNNLTHESLDDWSYAQSRDIVAESFEMVDNGVSKRCYYLRLDNAKMGENEKNIFDRMTMTNFQNEQTKFDLSRVKRWGRGGTIINGTRTCPTGAQRAAADEVEAGDVFGDILLLEPEKVVGNVASGKVSYTYDVGYVENGTSCPISMDPQSPFTLKWTADATPGVVTSIVDFPGAFHGKVISTTYHNLAGMTSDKPWHGVNIVVTRYSDGTTETTKVLR